MVTTSPPTTISWVFVRWSLRKFVLRDRRPSFVNAGGRLRSFNAFPLGTRNIVEHSLDGILSRFIFQLFFLNDQLSHSDCPRHSS